MNPLDTLDSLPRAIVPRVLSFIGPADICNIWRTWWPSGYLATKGYICDFVRYENFTDQLPLIESGRYNTIVTPRIAFGTTDTYTGWRNVINKADLLWVYDLDDDILSPEFVDRQVRVMAGKEGVLPRDKYEAERVQRVWLLQQVNGVTVTTPQLAEVVKKVTPNTVHVLTNHINVAAFKQVVAGAKRQLAPLTIGWSGTLREDADLHVMAQAWGRIAGRFPDVRFVLHGYVSPSILMAVPTDRLTVLPINNPVEHPQSLINIDIACCAVSDDPWNLNKTGIKWMEATLAGSACVVSKALYGQYVEHMMTGLVANDVDSWERSLAMLIEQPELRARLQSTASVAVNSKHSLEARWPEWVMTWSALLDERARLRSGRTPYAPSP